MKSILRFLSIVIMLQVSTPLMHGMAVDVELAAVEADELVGNSSTYGEKVKKHWPSRGFQKIKPLLKGLLALGITAVAFGGMLGIIQLLKGGADTGDSGENLHKCYQFDWNRNLNNSCNAAESLWAVNLCQKRLRRGKCVVVCNNKYYGQVWNYYQIGWKCAANKQCDEFRSGEEVAYILCSKESADEVIQKNIPYCLFEIEEGDSCHTEIDPDTVGLLIPHSYLEDAVNLTAYNEIAEHPEYMKGKCSDFADKARELSNCRGPIVKPKKKTPPKRTKGKRRTQ